MSDNVNLEGFESQKARIVVVGAGGGGSNTITTLTDKNIKGAVTVAVNTDARHLHSTRAHNKILIGKSLTRGLGAGGFPEIGKNAALESKQSLREVLQGVDLAFLTCGLGGGTGTGSLPVVARLAKEQDAIVIAVVTLPFKLEGARVVKAEEGLAQLRQSCDTVIVIENQKLLELAGKLSVRNAFAMADDLIATMIKGITETISEPSLVNLDYADVRAIMKQGGVASIGIGESDAPNRAADAVTKALNNPLLDMDISGATGALVQVIGGTDMRLDEIDLIGKAIQDKMHPDAQVIWGARVLPEFSHKIQVITIVTGVKSTSILGPVRRDTVAKSRVSRDFGIEVIK